MNPPAFLVSRNAPGRLPFPVALAGTKTGRGGVKVPREPGIFKRGDRRYKFYRLPVLLSGPGRPPKGFLNGNNSATEWMCYWAFTKILGPEGRLWTYQKAVSGGRKIPGGAVVDFVLMLGTLYAVRVQTVRYHIGAPTWKRHYDEQQRLGLQDNGYRVVDLWEPRFVNDKTGRAVLYVCRLATQGIEQPPPFGSRGNGIKAM